MFNLTKDKKMAPSWPKKKDWYITPDGMIEFVLVCALVLITIMYVDKAIDYHNVVTMREEYDSAFCAMRAKVDTIQAFIGIPRS